MLPVAAVSNESNVEPAAPTRAEVLARYRHLRQVSKHHHSKALKFLSIGAMLQQGRRLGVSDGKRFILDNMSELDLVSDLAIYTAPPGRSRALDRYAGNVPPAPGSDAELMLGAMRSARFAVLKMRRPHPIAGLIFFDDARGEEVWVVDEGLEVSLEEGVFLATRYFTPKPFSMAAGVFVPLDSKLLERTVELVPHLLRKRSQQLLDDPRFAEALYRAAIEGGVMERVRFQDPPAEGYAA